MSMNFNVIENQNGKKAITLSNSFIIAKKKILVSCPCIDGSIPFDVMLN